MDSSITTRLNDAMMAAPAAYRGELREWIQRAALRRSGVVGITAAELDELVALGRVYLGIDVGNARQRRQARRVR